MSQYFLDAGVSLHQCPDNVQRNIELNFRKFLPTGEFGRIVGDILLPMDIPFYLFIRDDDLMALPPVIFPSQQARIFKFDADAGFVEITLLLPPAKAAVVRDPVERQELDDAPIPPDQEMGTHA